MSDSWLLAVLTVHVLALALGLRFTFPRLMSMMEFTVKSAFGSGGSLRSDESPNSDSDKASA